MSCRRPSPSPAGHQESGRGSGCAAPGGMVLPQGRGVRVDRPCPRPAENDFPPHRASTVLPASAQMVPQ
eukprot:3986285-Alexandrium_andersonii.AAC.1